MIKYGSKSKYSAIVIALTLVGFSLFYYFRPNEQKLQEAEPMKSEVSLSQSVKVNTEQPIFYPDSICKAAVGFFLMVDDFQNMSVELFAERQVRVKGFAPYNGGDYDYICSLNDGKIDFYDEDGRLLRSDLAFEYKVVGRQLRIQELIGGNVQKENYFGLRDGTRLTLER